MNDKLKKLSESLYLQDSEDIPIQIGEAVLMRSEGTAWVPCVYMGYSGNGLDPYLFRSGENWHCMIAPMAGNEDCIGTEKDPFGIVDAEWMREKGLI